MKLQLLLTRTNHLVFYVASRRHPLKKSFGTILLLAVTLPLFSSNVGARTGVLREQPVAKTSDRYTELYDMFFKRNARLEGQPEQFVMTLRYTLTTGDRDFQYTVTKYLDGRVKVLAMRSLRGPRLFLDLEYPLHSLSEQQFESAKEGAKATPVETREIDLATYSARNFVSSFSALSFPQLINLDLLHFDGTKYDLWLEAGSYKVNYSFNGEALGSRKFAHPLVKWMNQAHGLLSRDIWNGN